jgi:hypothetical protein
MARTFRKFIAGIKAGGFPMGHFVVDAQNDRDFPDVKTWEELQTYLAGRKAQAEALKTAGEYWSMFEEQARLP